MPSSTSETKVSESVKPLSTSSHQPTSSSVGDGRTTISSSTLLKSTSSHSSSVTLASFKTVSSIKSTTSHTLTSAPHSQSSDSPSIIAASAPHPSSASHSPTEKSPAQTSTAHSSTTGTHASSATSAAKSLKESSGHQTSTSAHSTTSAGHSTSSPLIADGFSTTFSAPLITPSNLPAATAAELSTSSGFLHNKGAETGVFLVVSLVAIALAAGIFFFCRRRQRRRLEDRPWNVYENSLTDSANAMMRQTPAYSQGHSATGFDREGSIISAPSADTHSHNMPTTAEILNPSLTYSGSRLNTTYGPQSIDTLLKHGQYTTSQANPFDDLHAARNVVANQPMLSAPVRPPRRRPTSSGRSSPSVYTPSISSVDDDADSLYERETSIVGHEQPSMVNHTHPHQQALQQQLQNLKQLQKQLVMPQPVHVASRGVPKIFTVLPRSYTQQQEERRISAHLESGAPPFVDYKTLNPPGTADSGTSTLSGSSSGDGTSDTYVSTFGHPSPTDEQVKFLPGLPIQSTANGGPPVVPPRHPARMASPVRGVAV